MVHLVSRAGQASVSAGVSGDGGRGTCTLWHPLDAQQEKFQTQDKKLPQETKASPNRTFHRIVK